jgi:hypothetical protein
MPLEIEVGKRYRTRSGDVVEIIAKEKRLYCPFVGRIEGATGSAQTFHKNGDWGSGYDHSFDLIEELPADVDLLEGKPK